MFIQNLIRYRRLVIILVGLIVINVITRFVIDNTAHDNFALIAYLLFSIIWIDLIRVITEPNVKMVDQWIKEDNGY